MSVWDWNTYEARKPRVCFQPPHPSPWIQVAAMPATSSHAEAARAKYGVGGVTMVDINLLGTHPENRGQLGLSSFHAHRVVSSIMTDGFSRHRYRDATVVRVPPEGLAQFRKFNADLSAADDKLAPFNDGMRFALLSKNHLVAALKLLRNGTVVLHESTELIRADKGDSQLKNALEEGVACEMMSEALWHDVEAVKALIAEDNLNASVEMSTNEMEILSFMSSELQAMAEDMSPKERFACIMEKARSRFGNQAFKDSDLLHLHNFAVRIPRSLCKRLCELHFATIPASALRCKAIDFDLIAKIDTESAHCKVALVVSLYFGAANEAGSKSRRGVTGLAAVVKGINGDVLRYLDEHPDVLQTAETFLKATLKHYRVDGTPPLIKALLNCRARLYYRMGRTCCGPLAFSSICRYVRAYVRTRFVRLYTCASVFFFSVLVEFLWRLH